MYGSVHTHIHSPVIRLLHHGAITAALWCSYRVIVNVHAGIRVVANISRLLLTPLLGVVYHPVRHEDSLTHSTACWYRDGRWLLDSDIW